MVTYSDPGELVFDAVLRRSEEATASGYVMVDLDVAELFGTRGRVPVLATFDGVPYSGSLVTYGQGHLIIVRRDIREQIGKDPGDTVHVTLRLDTTVRRVELADDVRAALSEAGRLEEFRAMSYSHQREYARWIEEAKRSSTRAARISRTVEDVAAGRRLR